ncbi:DUF4430 domain-containing protein [Paenibacillus daejeonensis]|uniref:DUF4430 domain-containing protein n=1 Tax=Paenibacillus daejeonensis TaxID=135193 RepID=UPI00035F45FD|nr:DUF4430 domain-containing protein [Paenibacillus daejeonensis]
MNTRNRWIVAAVIVLILVVVFIWEGRGQSQPSEPLSESAAIENTQETNSADSGNRDSISIAGGMTDGELEPDAAEGSAADAAGTGLDAAGNSGVDADEHEGESGAGEATAPETPAADESGSTASSDLETQPTTPETPGNSAAPSEQPATTPPKASAPETAKPPVKTPEAPAAGSKDKYQTDPVPEGKAPPVEWQEAEVDKNKALTATLSVSATTLLDKLDRLDPNKLEVLPQDGIIFKSQKVTFYEGESVFDVLLREMKKHKIHMEFVMTPLYNSNYIEGINNLYEFDAGELSGWMYKVNGWFPNYGSSRYALEDGDVVEWVYTTDLGRDVGGDGAAGGNGG